MNAINWLRLATCSPIVMSEGHGSEECKIESKKTIINSHVILITISLVVDGYATVTDAKTRLFYFNMQCPTIQEKFSLYLFNAAILNKAK